MRQLWVVIATLTFSTATLADCIQSPERILACPHQIYRLGQLDNMAKPAMLCICVADFKEFLTVPADADEAHKQKIKRLKLEYALGQKIEPILQVLKD
ncbi:hypothetical protein [Rheinheimera mangrovi]|uniref:hypothetical protein n=1 Tax=Rheinheimera mangrovi TaxID=2498451 RepID=UPI000F8DC467|nr:hypothetical protein [Rheinheimera mangrovi]